MEQQVIPFLTFNGQSKEVMNFYLSVFPSAKIIELVPYDMVATNPAEKEFILHGEIEILGSKIMFMDMTAEPQPAPKINWSTSIYLNCKDEAEFDTIFAGLSKDGEVMMGPEPVGDLRKVAWVTDKFGVTWQPVFA